MNSLQPLRPACWLLVFALGACAYPGGTQQFVHTYGHGSNQRVTVDEDAGMKMISFALASRDGKFAECVKAGDTALALKYVTAGNVNKKIDGGEPIFYAAVTGNREMADMLIAHGANLDVETRLGQSPAFLAAACGHPDLARHLAREGGGSSGDVAAGERRNAELAAQRREDARRGMEIFSAVASVLLSSGNGPSSSDADEYDARARELSAERTENNAAVLDGRDMPYSAAGSDYQ